MNHRLVTFVIVANLLALTLLCLVYPHLMVGPGPLIDAHAKMATDCFACHDSFRGATAEKCITCHKLDDIGRISTTGQPITGRKTAVAFHQKLSRQDCTACHSDHRGVAAYRPKSRFSHDLLDAATRDQCEACHQKPADSLHGKIAGNCRQCHFQDRWKPATFNHEKFVLDGDHNVACATCHVADDFSRYTCYGCHEHSRERMIAKHAEEGIRQLDKCVDCHKSADGEGEHGGRSRERD